MEVKTPRSGSPWGMLVIRATDAGEQARQSDYERAVAAAQAADTASGYEQAPGPRGGV